MKIKHWIVILLLAAVMTNKNLPAKPNGIPEENQAMSVTAESSKNAAVSESPEDVSPMQEPSLKVASKIVEEQTAAVQDTIEETSREKFDDIIPDVVTQAKTGYEAGDSIPKTDPAPTASEKADIEVAMRVAKEYAVTRYGMIIDTSLNLDNSSYRFPAAVPVTASQETLNAKTIDMVEYTFQQLMRADKLSLQDFTDLGFRCNVFTYESNGEFLTYVFYDA